MTATQTWRLRRQHYSLCSGICPACSAVHFPPREVCTVCGAPQHLPIVALLPAMAVPIEALRADVLRNAASDARRHD